jgi:uncharacterized protein
MVTARVICKGKVHGEVLFTSEAISFFGGVDPDTGIVTEKGHELEGKCISGKILVFPSGKGSTVGSYVLYRLKKNGKAPLAIVNKNCEAIIATGVIISEIPCVDQVDIDKLKGKTELIVDGDVGKVTIL